ncbi:MAG TPA: exodeoxyribonuclease VII small subunit [Firmicutes bacterium]|nr:exodeoxyribonuclease VII small subunit [Bacillota bacterium]
MEEINDQENLFPEEIVETETSKKEEKKRKDEKTFEENIAQLESIVKELETGSCSLDAAIEKFTEGMRLAKVCGDKLSSATEKVNKILTENGTLEDFEVKED